MGKGQYGPCQFFLICNVMIKHPSLENGGSQGHGSSNWLFPSRSHWYTQLSRLGIVIKFGIRTCWCFSSQGLSRSLLFPSLLECSVFLLGNSNNSQFDLNTREAILYCQSQSLWWHPVIVICQWAFRLGLWWLIVQTMAYGDSLFKQWRLSQCQFILFSTSGSSTLMDELLHKMKVAWTSYSGQFEKKLSIVNAVCWWHEYANTVVKSLLCLLMVFYQPGKMSKFIDAYKDVLNCSCAFQ